MKINGQSHTTIWQHPDDPTIIQIIDQRWLPHQLVIEDLRTLEDFEIAIREMHVRGAPLIGVTSGFGMYRACLDAPKKDFEKYLEQTAIFLKAARPTAVNLAYVVDRIMNNIAAHSTIDKKIKQALLTAQNIRIESIARCKMIGEYGVSLIEKIAATKPDQPVNILTHCNAGWMACIDYGTATAPIYEAHRKGIPVHVWVDETRPRNQGARITAWELGQEGVPHTVIPDNTGGHLMQHSMVDLVIVGSDRTTRTGDVANKIGTYLKALAAKDNSVPFYVALPLSTFDMELTDGVAQIPIEQRDPTEVTHIQGWTNEGIATVRLTPERSTAVNYGFDVTPARLVTGLITEKGICGCNEEEIKGLFI